MTDDQRKGFWRRLKDRLASGTEPATQQARAKPADETSAKQAEARQDALPERAEQAVDPPTNDPSPPKQAENREPSVLSTSELKTDKVGRVYAEALLELAQEQGVADTLADEVQALLPMIAHGGELHRLLVNPSIGGTERAQIMQRVFEGKVSPLLYKMMKVIGDKGRLGSLPEVAAGYLLAIAEVRGQIEVEAFVATEMDSETAKRVTDQIGKVLGKTVSLRQKVDPSLIGGLKIKVGDQLIDASVASQLRVMKNKIIAASRA